MPMKSSAPKGAARPVTRTLPLRLILIIPFLLEITAAVGITGWLSIRNGQQAIADVVNQLMDEVTNRVDQRLDQYVENAAQVVELNVAALEQGVLDLEDFEETGNLFYQQVNIFGVSYVYFTSAQGDYVGAGYWGANDPNIYIDHLETDIDPLTHSFVLDEQGVPIAVEPYEYDPLSEASYIESLGTKETTWSHIHPWSDSEEIIAASLIAPIYQTDGEYVGIIAVDLVLDYIDDFLESLKLSPNARVFVVEANGDLVASSAIELPYILVDGTAQRLKADASEDRLIRQTAQFLDAEFPEAFGDIETVQKFEFQRDGDRHFALVTPWRDPYGLDWRGVVVPQSDFMAQIHRNTRNTVMLCLVALLVAIALGTYTAQQINTSVLSLVATSERLATGDLTAHAQPSAIHEINVLGRTFNAMATKLQGSFQALSAANADLKTLNETLEARVAERTLALQIAKEEADSASQAKSEFWPTSAMNSAHP